MKILNAPITALFAIAMTCSSQAGTVNIASPDQGLTRADSSIFNRGLHWNAREQRLTAVITFSNQSYGAPGTHHHDDTLAFSLPGIRFDEANKVFYAASKGGERTPIAKWRVLVFGKKIQLLPGAVIVVQENRGSISIQLVNGQPPSAPHWREVRPSAPQP